DPKLSGNKESRLAQGQGTAGGGQLKTSRVTTIAIVILLVSLGLMSIFYVVSYSHSLLALKAGIYVKTVYPAGSRLSRDMLRRVAGLTNHDTPADFDDVIGSCLAVSAPINRPLTTQDIGTCEGSSTTGGRKK